MPTLTQKYVNYTRNHQLDIPEATFFKDLSYTIELEPHISHDILILSWEDFGPGFPHSTRSVLIFAKVEGADDGDYFISNFGIYSIKVGTKDVVITAYYATYFELYYPNNGEPYTGLYNSPDIDTPPGYYIDAFNINKLDWVESDFVNIYSHNILETAATNSANKSGVFLTNFLPTLQAVNAIGDSKFVKWLVVRPFDTVVVSTAVMQLKQSASGFIFALYSDNEIDDPIRKPTKPFHREVGPVRITPGVAVDGGGFVIGPGGKPIPIDPWGPLREQIAKLNLLIKASERNPSELSERNRLMLLNQLEVLMKVVREIGRR